MVGTTEPLVTFLDNWYVIISVLGKRITFRIPMHDAVDASFCAPRSLPRHERAVFPIQYQRNETDLSRASHRRVRAPMLMLGVGAAMASSRDKFMPIHRETFRSLYAK
jgi:hypothetical protein